MKKGKPDRSHAAELRQQAEARLQSEKPLPAEISPAEAQKLIHELRVHQIELEMQNDELRQAQEILEESRSRYSDLYDFAPIGYLTLDELGIIREANLTAARLLQVERSRLIDRQLTHFMVMEDRGAFRRHLILVLKGRERQTCELRLQRKDGEEFFALLESAFYQDTTGSSLCRTAFTDITKRWRAEADLRESEARYRSLFKNNHAVMLLIDPATGDLVDANPAACNFYGYPHEELISRKITDINMLPKDQVFQEMQRAGSEQRRHFFFRHRLAGGEVRDVEVFSGPIHLQGQGLLYSIIHDITARKQAEEALRNSNKRTIDILESISDGFFSTDKEMVVTYFNSAAAKILGRNPSEVVGRKLFDAFPEARGSVLEERYTEALRESKVIYFETYFEPEPYRNWYDVRVFPYEGGISVYFQVTTERKRAEEALRDSEEFNRRVIASSADCIKVLDLEGRLLSMSEGGQRLLEITDFGPFLNRNWIEFWQEEDCAKVANALAAAMAGGTGQFQAYFPTVNGTPKYWDVIITPILGSDAKPQRLLSISRDITSKKEAEEALLRLNEELEHRVQERTADLRQTVEQLQWEIAERQRAEEALAQHAARLQDLYNNAPCGYHSLDPEGTFVQINDTELAWLGYARDEVLGRLKFSDLITSAGLKVYQKNFPELKKRGWVQDLEYEMVRKDGTILPVHLNATALKDEAGHFLMSRSTVFDITERKRAEAEILKLNEELEQRVRERTAELETANKELDAFSYSVSHDLKAPLRAIQGFSRMLLAKHAPRLDQEGLRLLNVVCDNTMIMAQLIDDLLALAHLGRQPIRKSAIDLTAMTNQVFQHLHSQEPKRDTQITIGDLPEAFGDHNLIKQVMINLLANAVKYSKVRKTVEIEVGGCSAGDENIYYVKDNGIGFDERYAETLFGVFQRLHRGEEYEGTGIGLAIVQRIIQRHGGRVWAEGKVDQGATFYFALPKNE